MSEEEAKFYTHLDICQRCREEIFNLCPLGEALLVKAEKAAGESMCKGLLQWNKVLAK